MRKLLLFDASKCTGCKTCEMACSLIQTGVCNPASSRRRTIHFDEDILDVPMQCQQCGNAACMNICPVNAIYTDESTGAKILDGNKCIGCRMCMIACPFGAMIVDPTVGRMAKCNLCDGDPACAKFCPTGAIQYLPADTYGFMRQKEAAQQLSKIMSQVAKGGA